MVLIWSQSNYKNKIETKLIKVNGNIMADIKKLAEEIVSLTLLQAVELKTILKDCLL